MRCFQLPPSPVSCWEGIRCLGGGPSPTGRAKEAAGAGESCRVLCLWESSWAAFVLLPSAEKYQPARDEDEESDNLKAKVVRFRQPVANVIEVGGKVHVLCGDGPGYTVRDTLWDEWDDGACVDPAHVTQTLKAPPFVSSSATRDGIAVCVDAGLGWDFRMFAWTGSKFEEKWSFGVEAFSKNRPPCISFIQTTGPLSAVVDGPRALLIGLPDGRVLYTSQSKKPTLLCQLVQPVASITTTADAILVFGCFRQVMIVTAKNGEPDFSLTYTKSDMQGNIATKNGVMISHDGSHLFRHHVDGAKFCSEQLHVNGIVAFDLLGDLCAVTHHNGLLVIPPPYKCPPSKVGNTSLELDMKTVVRKMSACKALMLHASHRKEEQSKLLDQLGILLAINARRLDVRATVHHYGAQETLRVELHNDTKYDLERHWCWLVQVEGSQSVTVRLVNKLARGEKIETWVPTDVRPEYKIMSSVYLTIPEDYQDVFFERSASTAVVLDTTEITPLDLLDRIKGDFKWTTTDQRWLTAKPIDKKTMFKIAALAESDVFLKRLWAKLGRDDPTSPFPGTFCAYYRGEMVKLRVWFEENGSGWMSLECADPEKHWILKKALSEWIQNKKKSTRYSEKGKKCIAKSVEDVAAERRISFSFKPNPETRDEALAVIESFRGTTCKLPFI